MAEKRYNPPIPFRASDFTIEQLDALGDKWKLNRSQVVIHCIARVWQEELGKESKGNVGGKNE